MGNHTATPWILGPYGQIWVGVHQVDGRWDEVAAGSAVIVASASHNDNLPCEANRAFIVKAVNHHDDLVSLLSRARDFVEIDATGEDDNGGTALLAEIDAALKACEARS
jgi:hypothetical protein